MTSDRVNGTSSLKTYTGTVPQGGTLQFDIVGSFVKLIATNSVGGQFAAPIRLRSDTGLSADVFPGQGFRGDFSRLYVDDLVNFAAQKITLQIGDGDLIDSTLTGTVNIADGARLRTLNNLSFGALMSRVPAAGQRAAIALQNPSGATRRCVTERIIIGNGGTVAATFLLQSSVTSLAGWTVGSAGRSKYPRISGNAGTPAFPASNDVANPASTEGGIVLPAGSNGILVGASPWILEPGTALIVFCNVADAGFYASFEWYEENF